MRRAAWGTCWPSKATWRGSGRLPAGHRLRRPRPGTDGDGPSGGPVGQARRRGGGSGRLPAGHRLRPPRRVAERRCATWSSRSTGRDVSCHCHAVDPGRGRDFRRAPRSPSRAGAVPPESSWWAAENRLTLGPPMVTSTTTAVVLRRLAEVHGSRRGGPTSWPSRRSTPQQHSPSGLRVER